ncbi:MAG: DUF4214 domain-containing protein [Devosia sp.]|nr:DUF4214 domain-containing protein [Devosia sp.]
MATYVDDYRALITSTSSWNHIYNQPFKAKSVFLTYSFAETVPPKVDGINYEDPNYFRPLTEAERAIYREAIETWGAVSGIVFFEAPGGLGDVEVGGYKLDGNTAGQASMPSSDIYLQSGRPGLFAPSSGYSGVFLDQKSGMNLHVMLHEIGHALGLEHPHDGTDPLLSPSKDNGHNTVMSYNDYFPKLGVMDVQAIQALYGTPDQKGSHVASWSWDAQTFTLTQSATGAGEVLHGTAANDVIYAGGGRDVVVTRGGDDIIFVQGKQFAVNAGAGFDTVVTDIFRSSIWDVSHSNEIVNMLANGANSWDMVVMQAERIVFADAVLAYDFEGNAGQAYRLYQAAFNRTPDEKGLGYWIKSLDQGQGNVYWAAQQFIGSNEFTQLYGTASSVSHESFVGLLYRNVLKRGPDGDGFNFWVDGLKNGTLARDAVLVNFSDSAENKANVAAEIHDGIWFS